MGHRLYLPFFPLPVLAVSLRRYSRILNCLALTSQRSTAFCEHATAAFCAFHSHCLTNHPPFTNNWRETRVLFVLTSFVFALYVSRNVLLRCCAVSANLHTFVAARFFTRHPLLHNDCRGKGIARRVRDSEQETHTSRETDIHRGKETENLSR